MNTLKLHGASATSYTISPAGPPDSQASQVGGLGPAWKPPVVRLGNWSGWLGLGGGKEASTLSQHGWGLPFINSRVASPSLFSHL